MDDNLRYGEIQNFSNADPKALRLTIEIDGLLRAIYPTSLDPIYRIGIQKSPPAQRPRIEAEYDRHRSPSVPFINMNDAYLQAPTNGNWKTKAKEIASILHHERTHVLFDDIVASGREAKYVAALAERCGGLVARRGAPIASFTQAHLLAHFPLLPSRARDRARIEPGDPNDIHAKLLKLAADRISEGYKIMCLEELVARTHELQVNGWWSPARDAILDVTFRFAPAVSDRLSLLTHYFREAEALTKDNLTWIKAGFLSLEGTDDFHAKNLAKITLRDYTPPELDRSTAVKRLQDLTGGLVMLSHTSGRDTI